MNTFSDNLYLKEMFKKKNLISLFIFMIISVFLINMQIRFLNILGEGIYAGALSNSLLLAIFDRREFKRYLKKCGNLPGIFHPPSIIIVMVFYTLCRYLWIWLLG